MHIELNDNDNKLLAYCYNQRRTISEIARFLEIAPKNVSVRIDKLKEAKLIRVEDSLKGNKKFIRTIEGDKTKEYFIELLSELKQKGGILPQEEFFKLLPFSFEEPDGRDKFSAPMQLQYTYPSLVELMVRITPAGEKFLAEHSKNNKK